MMRRKRAARQGWEHHEPAGHWCTQHSQRGIERLSQPCLHMVGAQKRHRRGCAGEVMRMEQETQEDAGPPALTT